MKAVYIAEPGGPEKLIFGDRPDPEAGPGEVLIRVRGSAVNHADLAIRAGRSATGGLPRILGLDIAGEIARLGAGVTGWKEGERVVVENRVKCGACTPCLQGRDEYCERQKRLGGELDGGHAQYCKVPAANLQRIPEWMGFEEAATLPLAGHTAWHWMTARYSTLQLMSLPALDVALAATIVRWLLVLTVAGGGLYFLAGLLRKKPDTGEFPDEKSIVDSH